MKPAILKRTGELSPEIFNPFFTFFDFAYYLLLSPIRFSKTLQIPYEVKLHSSTIHSILVNIFLFMGYFLLTNNVRRSLGKSTTSKSPLFYFDILLPVVNIIIRIIFQVTFFKNKDKILHLFQLITKYRYILPRGKLPFFYRKCLSVLIGLGVTLTCFADFANLLRTNYFPYANANLTAYENFINGGRAMLFLASREHQGSEDAMDTVIVVLTSIAVVSGLLLGFYQNVVVFCGVHMVWTLSKFFRDSMNRLVDMETSKNGRLWVNECSQDEREKWEKVNSQYNCIKEICEAFSDAFGSMLMCYLVLTIIGDSRYIDHLLFSPEPHFILSVGTFVLSSTASLILAAEVTLNVCIKAL